MQFTRREWLKGSLAVAAGGSLGAGGVGAWPPSGEDAVDAGGGSALIAITFDLEMSRHYPTWDQTHWDYEKGNLDEATKCYAVEAGRRVRAQGGVIHYFAVGRVCEQENVDWLRNLSAAGHPIGNHTYDHVNVHARSTEDIQFRFQRAPWLIAGREPQQVIAENIRLCSEALKQRVGIRPAGFRTPGGSHDGLKNRPDLQQILLGQGFSWTSSLYPAHRNTAFGTDPDEDVFQSLLTAQREAQPFVYESGLVEIPMSPPSDVVAFRSGGWSRPAFLEAVRRGVLDAIEQSGSFDFLAHPSCLVVADPEFEVVDLICRLVREHAPRAKLASLESVAHAVRAAHDTEGQRTTSGG